MYKLKIVVEDVKGKCHAGYERGDTIEVEDPVIKGKICIYALSALIPYITAAYRETPPDDWINAVEVLQRPDPENTVRFRIIREK
ncbi:MAG TPA: TIGR04076 family protein [Thermococcus sp.]|nr:TIGR04076 family protein [Thermococcus sp.]